MIFLSLDMMMKANHSMSRIILQGSMNKGHALTKSWRMQ